MNRPEEWILPLRTVSPAFVGGAAPNDQAVLRVPSIRGALRAWYRLLVGPEVAAGMVQGAQAAAESRLFGGTAKGEGQGALLLALTDRAPTGTTPWRRRQGGLACLGFSLDMGANARKALASDTPFGLRFIWPVAPDKASRARAAAAAWLWTTLGGLGSRSRRGFGSLAWRQPAELRDWFGEPLEGSPFPQPIEHANSVGQAVDALAAGLRMAAESVAGLPGTVPQAHDTPVLRLNLNAPQDGRARVVLWGGPRDQGWRSAQDAMDAFGRAFAEFRRQRGIDGLGASPLKILSNGGVLRSPPARVSFGLPMTLRPLRGGQSFDLLPWLAEGREGGRAPSPLLARVCPLASGQFVMVLTLLAGAWAGRDVATTVRRQRGHQQPNPRLDLPHRFLNQLPGAREVRW